MAATADADNLHGEESQTEMAALRVTKAGTLYYSIQISAIPSHRW